MFYRTFSANILHGVLTFFIISHLYKWYCAVINPPASGPQYLGITPRQSHTKLVLLTMLCLLCDAFWDVTVLILVIPTDAFQLYLWILRCVRCLSNLTPLMINFWLRRTLFLFNWLNLFHLQSFQLQGALHWCGQ